MHDQPKYFTLTPEELKGYVVEEKPEQPKSDKRDRGKIALKEIRESIEILKQALNQRATEFGLPVPKLDLPPLPPDFTKEHLEALNEVFGSNNLEATVCPKPEELTDEYFQMMYPATQRTEDTARGLKSYHPGWWDKTASEGFCITSEEAEKTGKVQATWGELYTKSMQAESTQLGSTVLLSEIIQKSNYKDGNQHYGTKEGTDSTKDNLLPIIKEVFGNTANRFNLTWDQITQELIPKLKEKVLQAFQTKGLKEKDIEIIITPAIVSNLQTTLKHPTDSKTSTYDWTSTPLINQYDKDSGDRLLVGCSVDGGAGYVSDVLPGGRWNDGGFRLSVVLKST